MLTQRTSERACMRVYVGDGLLVIACAHRGHRNLPLLLHLSLSLSIPASFGLLPPAPSLAPREDRAFVCGCPATHCTQLANEYGQALPTRHDDDFAFAYSPPHMSLSSSEWPTRRRPASAMPLGPPPAPSRTRSPVPDAIHNKHGQRRMSNREPLARISILGYDRPCSP
jgi:hypothetical protein